MRVLLDTCVLSELRHPKGRPSVRRAVEALENDSLFVSVISIGEIAKAVVLLKESHTWGELTAAAQKSRKDRSRK